MASGLMSWCRRRVWCFALFCLVVVLFVNWRLHRMLTEPPGTESTSLTPKVDLFVRTLDYRLRAEPSTPVDYSALWKLTRRWPTEKQMYPIDESVGFVLSALRTAEVIHADFAKRGTQLKVVLTLQGGERVFFKPMWYPRNEVIRGHVYAGKDRHNSEVVAFYLSAVLDVRWAPPAALRLVDVKKDIFDKATPELRDTMFFREDGNLCLYGKCFYCRRNESVCGNDDNKMEGAVIYLIDQNFSKYRSPWQRTYKENVQADWEANPDYCDKVKQSLSTVRLLDLIDVSIFDYLMQNGDRHHYETAMGRVIYLDNGKGLGNPHKDFDDILAPLYQCCTLRQSTWKRLKMLSGGYLSASLSALTSGLPGSPVATEQHLRAMDRRLMTVYSTVGACIKKHGKSVLVNK